MNATAATLSIMETPAANNRLDVNTKKNGKKRPLRYIKRHIINADDFTEKLHGNRSFQRHTLVWYVIGHWRAYSNGKKVFIKPYWKGALRDTKSANAREREIVLEEKK